MTPEAELRQLIAELSLVSHVCAASLSPSRNGTPQSKDPTGGIDRQDDSEQGWPLKSADHFRRRASKANTDKDREAILADARASLNAFRRQPDWKKGEAEPERKTLRWKRMIANSDEKIEVLARRHEISRRTVDNYRALYGRNGSVWPSGITQS